MNDQESAMKEQTISSYTSALQAYLTRLQPEELAGFLKIAAETVPLEGFEQFRQNLAALQEMAAQLKRRAFESSCCSIIALPGNEVTEDRHFILRWMDTVHLPEKAQFDNQASVANGKPVAVNSTGFQDKLGRNLIDLIDSDKTVGLFFRQCFRPESRCHVCFIMGSQLDEKNQNFPIVFKNGQQTEADLAKLKPAIEFNVDNGTYLVRANLVKAYINRWVAVFSGAEDRHLIIVVDTCQSGRLVDYLQSWANDNNGLVDTLLKHGCGITVQASCSNQEKAKPCYFTQTWIKVNSQLFPLNPNNDPPKSDSDESLLPSQSMPLVQTPRFLTVGTPPPNAHFLDNSDATYRFWHANNNDGETSASSSSSCETGCICNNC